MGVEDLVTWRRDPKNWLLRRASPTHPLDDRGLDTAFVSFGIVTETSALLEAKQWTNNSNSSKRLNFAPLKYQFRRGSRVVQIVANAGGLQEQLNFPSYDNATSIEAKSMMVSGSRSKAAPVEEQEDCKCYDTMYQTILIPILYQWASVLQTLKGHLKGLQREKTSVTRVPMGLTGKTFPVIPCQHA